MERTILVADDEQMVRKVVARALEGYRVLAAEDGEQAMRLAESERPDLVILDMYMPNKDGGEVARRLRAGVGTRFIPIVMLTGAAEVADKVRGFSDLEVDDYITKPFHVEELRARIDGLLRRNLKALSANPLTLLPGAPVIEEEVARRIGIEKPFAYLYLDIDNFKAYNDAYGYLQGDQAIRLLQSVLLESVREKGREDDLVGHIGGDDFVLVTDADRAEALAQDIASRFDCGVPHLYRRQDRERGSIVSHDRQGVERNVPLMELSIAVVTNERRVIEHCARAVDIAFEIKSFLKKRPGGLGSVFLKDRRTDDDGPVSRA